MSSVYIGIVTAVANPEAWHTSSAPASDTEDATDDARPAGACCCQGMAAAAAGACCAKAGGVSCGCDCGRSHGCGQEEGKGVRTFCHVMLLLLLGQLFMIDQETVELPLAGSCQHLSTLKGPDMCSPVHTFSSHLAVSRSLSQMTEQAPSAARESTEMRHLGEAGGGV